MEHPSAHDQMARLIHGYWAAQAVYVAAKLELADLLAERPQSANELAQATGAHAQSLHRLLRALASIGVFREEEAGRFAMTPLAETLRKDGPQSLWAMAVMMGEETYHVWGDLFFSIETGQKAFDRIYGIPFFEYLAENPEKSRVFDAAMTAIHGRETEPIIAGYDFSAIGTLADIGGGNGSLLTAILHRHPRMKGMLFDLPGVIECSAPAMEAAGLADRCQAIGGDFFQEVPAGADVYLLRHIIHDWDDEKAALILRNVRAAMRPDSRVLVVESVLPPGNDPSFAKFLDLTMLLVPGGQERTHEEYARLFNAAGLQITQVVPTSLEISVIEGRKAA
jgi:hypothetical protein